MAMVSELRCIHHEHTNFMHNEESAGSSGFDAQHFSPLLLSQGMRRWSSMLSQPSQEHSTPKSLQESNRDSFDSEVSHPSFQEKSKDCEPWMQAKSFSFKTPKDWQNRRSTRRHSIAIGTVSLPEMPELDKTRSRRNSDCSDISVASFAGREYSSMMAAWVDDELENNLMVLSGSDFRIIALQPLRESVHAKPDGDASQRAGKESERTPPPPQADDRKLELAPTSEHVEQASDDPSYVPRLAKPKSKKSSHSKKSKAAHRRSSLMVDASNWPVFSSGVDELNKVKQTLSTFAFNALQHSADDLTVIVSEIFFEMGLDASLNISRSSIQGFIMAVRARMLDNAYHNWTHVVDVTQTVYALAIQSGILSTLTNKQRLVLFLAALCHDLEHPGVTAGYLLKSKSTLAARYKADLGLLEKHHSIRAFQLLACHDINLLESLSNMEKLEVTSLVRDVIMATDMRQHAEYAAAVQARISAAADAAGHAAGAISHSAANRDDAAAGEGAASAPDALFSMQLLLKCADISNVLKPFSVAREWAIRVTDEFFAQGDLERANGLDVTPICDRDRQSRVDLQRGFIDHVAGPFHRDVARLLPRLQPLLEQMEENRRRWAEVTDEELMENRGGA